MGHIGRMLPADAQLHVIGELLTELVSAAKRHEALLQRVVLLLGELGRRERGGFAARRGTREEYLRDMAESSRRAIANRRVVPLIMHIASLGGKATKSDLHRRFGKARYWLAAEQLERDGLVRISKIGRHTVVELTDLASAFLDDDDGNLAEGRQRRPRISS